MLISLTGAATGPVMPVVWPIRICADALVSSKRFRATAARHLALAENFLITSPSQQLRAPSEIATNRNMRDICASLASTAVKRTHRGGRTGTFHMTTVLHRVYDATPFASVNIACLPAIASKQAIAPTRASALATISGL